MAQLKCFSTGHFFVCFPDAENTFTCYECLEEFATIHVKPMEGVYGDVRKRRSLYGVPVKQDLPRNYAVDDNGEDCGLVDKNGRKRSKPWRCLQARCKLLACEECSDKLIDPKFAGGRSDGDSSTETVRNATFDTTAHIPENSGTKAGDSTPHAIEYQKENQNPASTSNMHSESSVKTEAKTEPKVHFKTERKAEDTDTSMLEVDSTDSPAGSQDSPPNLVYRRATEVGNNGLAHFHHRPPGPRMPRAPMVTVEEKDKSKISRLPPRSSLQKPALSPVKPHQPLNVSASSSYQAGAPAQIKFSSDGPVLAADSASSDDEVSEEQERLDIMALPVRSARQAANQAMRNMHLKMRERASRGGEQR